MFISGIIIRILIDKFYPIKIIKIKILHSNITTYCNLKYQKWMDAWRAVATHKLRAAALVLISLEYSPF